ncbi:MAG: phage tail protein [Ruminococcus sp.]|nr:phage tail protein [Ruminococcus sp.]
MYRIKCDGYTLFDLRQESLILHEPKVTLEVNTVGGGSFTIYDSHPYYHVIGKKRSVIEVSDDYGVIFRGRVTDDTVDFNNGKAVDLEGAMAFFNDSVVRPYAFPDDFLSDAEYVTAAESGNVVEFFLKRLIDDHNSQVEPFQRFKLGTVTVSDPNNYIRRSDTGYNSTWSVLSSKLFGSELGGYLCIRYEEDGNYIDYLSRFTLMNTQEINFGENLLDIKSETDAAAAYSAIIPIGAENSDTKRKLTISDLADGDITSDIVKVGDTLYSRKAVEAYGWIYAPVSETTWEDVTEADNLLKKGVSHLTNTAVKMPNTVEVTAVDLHYTDHSEYPIESFRIYRNIKVTSKPHDHEGIYPLTKLDIDIINPQNTKITIGNKKMTFTAASSQQLSDAAERIRTAENDIKETKQITADISKKVDNLPENLNAQVTSNSERISEHDKTLENMTECVTANTADVYNRCIGGKNLLTDTMLQTQITGNGITVTLENGVYTLNGTAAERVELKITPDPTEIPQHWKGKPLILSGCPNGGGADTYRMFMQDRTTAYSALAVNEGGDTAPFTIDTAATHFRIVFPIYAGQTLNDIKVKPMLRFASVKDSTFVPYVPTNGELYEMLKSLM